MKIGAIAAMIAGAMATGAPTVRSGPQADQATQKQKDATENLPSGQREVAKLRDQFGGFSDRNKLKHQWIPGNQRQYRKKMRQNVSYARSKKNQRTRYT